jgi:predicted transcriptional regulator of viral defense system
VKVAKTTTNRARIYNTSLSRREVALLAGWERERRASVTLDDIRHAVGVLVARDVASRLVAKKALERIGAGRYLVRPLRTMSRPTATSAPVKAAVLLQGEPYYLGGLWALTFHRLTEQQYVSVLDAFVARRHSSRRLGGARLVFHRVNSKRLGYGKVATDLEGMSVQLSDPERTLVDLLDFPALAGGGSEALRMVKQTLPRVDRAKLVEYAARGARSSTCQRLGVLLERAGAAPRWLTELHKRVLKTKSVLSMEPGTPRKGPFNRRWSVIENDR